MRRPVLASLVLVLALAHALVAPLAAAEGRLLDGFDAPTIVPTEKCVVEVVDGKHNKALKLSWEAESGNKLARVKVRADESWDQAAGFSFWVKGDGSDNLGCIEFIWNDDYAQRYAYAFPLASKEWTKVTVAWRDLWLESSVPAGMPIDPQGDHKPSQLRDMWLNRWWYWKPMTAHAYALDELRLEPAIPLDTRDLKPKGDPLARVKAKLKAKKEVSLVTMGDSLTDTAHNTNRQGNWPLSLTQLIARDAGAKLVVTNPARGGTELNGNIVMMPVWTRTTPKPDLVTIFFGGNDKAAGATGESFARSLTEAVQRVRRVTDGAADVLIMTTCPNATDPAANGDLAEACRLVAKQENAGLCDVAAAVAALPEDQRKAFFAGEDVVHLGPAGHEGVARAVLGVLTGAK